MAAASLTGLLAPRGMAAIARLLMRDQATVLLMVGFLSLVLINILIQTRSVTGTIRGTVIAEAPTAPRAQPGAPAAEPAPAERPPAVASPAAVTAPQPPPAADPAGSTDPLDAALLPPEVTAEEFGRPPGSAAPQMAALQAPAGDPAGNMLRPADAPPAAPADAAAAQPPQTAASPPASPAPVAATPPEPPKVWRVQVGTYLRGAPGMGAPRIARVLPGIQATMVNTVENGDGSKWHEIETDYGRGFLPAFALEAGPRDREFTRPIFGVVRGVVDSATIEVGGRQVKLFGIVAAPGTWTDQFRDRMVRDAPTVTCISRGEERYRCITEDLVDLAELLLLNGAARSEASAPDTYLERELDAQKANRGVWKR